MLATPSQQRGLRAAHGLTREQTDRFVWLIDVETRQKWPGAMAISRVLKSIGGPWRLIGRLYDLPGMPWLQGRIYAWIAGNRRWFSRFCSARPGCAEHDADCEDEA